MRRGEIPRTQQLSVASTSATAGPRHRHPGSAGIFIMTNKKRAASTGRASPERS